MIEADVLRPYQEYEGKLQQYESKIRHHWPLSEDKQQEFKVLKETWKLKDEDIERIRKKIISSETTVQQAVAASKPSVSTNYWRRMNNFFTSNALYLLFCMFLGFLSLGTILGKSNTQPTPTTNQVNSTAGKRTKEVCENLWNEYKKGHTDFLDTHEGERGYENIKDDCNRLRLEFTFPDIK